MQNPSSPTKAKAAFRLWPLFVALLVSACAAPSHPPVRDDISSIKPQIGMASWYGGSLHGGLTANGETFDEAAFSAAHRTFPLPSLVQVKNVENGRTLIVRVNDRGPFAKGRLIDLSRAAAQALGFEHDGEAKVEVRYIGPAAAPGTKAPPV